MKKIRLIACITVLFMLININAFASFYAVSEYDWRTPSEEAKEACGHLNFYNLFKNDLGNVFWGRNRVFAYEKPVALKALMGRDMTVDVIVKLCEYNLGHELIEAQNCAFTYIPPYSPNEPLPPFRTPLVSVFETSIKKAYGFGLINGVSDKDFGNDGITNQELSVILYRAAKVLGCYNNELKYDLSLLENSGDIAEWALEGISYMFACGILRADFNPTAFMTKEEACMIIHSFALNHGLYAQLDSETIASTEYVRKLPVIGSLDELYMVLNEKESHLIQKAIELFPDAYQTIVFTGEHTKVSADYITSFTADYYDRENKEYATVILYSPKGDFEMKFTEKGIRFSLSVDIDDYDAYKELIKSVINSSPSKELYTYNLEKIRQQAYINAKASASFSLYAEEGDVVPNDIQSVLLVCYNHLYNTIRIEIDDLYRG